MKLLFLFVCFLCFSLYSGLIMPTAKPDLKANFSTLVSHIALLEQSIENTASAAEVGQLKTDLAAAKKELAATNTDLNQLKTDLATSQKELTDTKSELTQVKSKLDTTNVNLAAANAELTKLKSVQSLCQKDLAMTKSELNSSSEKLEAVSGNLTKVEEEIQIVQQQLIPKNSTSSTSQMSPQMVGLIFDVSHLTMDMSHLKSEVSQIQTIINDSDTTGSITGGGTFTRWGRTSCPADSNVVYKGYTAGTHFTDKASSASILCLPDQPVYGNHTPEHSDSSRIHGTEYSGVYEGAPFRDLYNEDMPCVVCESRSMTSVIMVPARNVCYPGWTLEYSGYLMGPSAQHASGEYICVDSDAEAIPGGHEDRNGQMLYPVESRCGSLSCPPYHGGWELICVVCSK